MYIVYRLYTYGNNVKKIFVFVVCSDNNYYDSYYGKLLYYFVCNHFLLELFGKLYF